MNSLEGNSTQNTVRCFEILFQGEKIGEAEGVPQLEKLMDQLESELKIKADRMIVKTVYVDERATGERHERQTDKNARQPLQRLRLVSKRKIVTIQAVC